MSLSYDHPLRHLLNLVMEDGSVDEDSMWHFIYSRVDGAALLKGKYADFVKDSPNETIFWVVKIYEDHIVKMRYANIDDILIKPVELPTCPITGLGVKPLDLGFSTIDALESVWEKYVGTSYDKEKLQIETMRFSVMMSRLLRITLHLEWAGFSGFATFEHKWKNLKCWRSGRYIDPLAVGTMKYFVIPPSWEETAFPDILPVDQRMRLYKEIEELYTSDVVDPTSCDRKKCLSELADAIIDDKSVSSQFKQEFMHHKGVTNDDKDG